MDDAARFLRPSTGLRIAVAVFLALWCVIAAFPLVWVALMSFRAPVDALSANPFTVLLAPATLRLAGGCRCLTWRWGRVRCGCAGAVRCAGCRRLRRVCPWCR